MKPAFFMPIFLNFTLFFYDKNKGNIVEISYNITYYREF